MRAAYLAMHRSDFRKCVKKLARRVQPPKEADMGKLKRRGRYLMGKLRVIQRFEAPLSRDEQLAKLMVSSVSHHEPCV